MLGYLIAFAAGLLAGGLFFLVRDIHRTIKREQIINTACATLYRHGIETAEYFPSKGCVQVHEIVDALSKLTGTGQVAISPTGELFGELRSRAGMIDEVHWLTLIVARRQVIDTSTHDWKKRKTIKNMDLLTKKALFDIIKKIDEIKGRTQSEYNPGDLHEIECELRRLADRAQVSGSPFLKV